MSFVNKLKCEAMFSTERLLEILKDFQFHLNQVPFASLQAWSQQMTMTLHHRSFEFR